MKNILPILVALGVCALASCVPPPPPPLYVPTSGPAGSWRGMNGTDVVTLTLTASGGLTMTTPGQTLTGSWQIVAPAIATARCNGLIGEFRLVSERDALFEFNQLTIEMHRSKAAAPASDPPPKRTESYYLNKIN